jgi:hypothetical protein
MINFISLQKASTVLYSIAVTAQVNGIDTEQYLTELFSNSDGKKTCHSLYNTKQTAAGVSTHTGGCLFLIASAIYYSFT